MSLEQKSSSAFESVIVDQPQNVECPEATCTPWPSYTLVSYTFIRYTGGGSEMGWRVVTVARRGVACIGANK